MASIRELWDAATRNGTVADWRAVVDGIRDLFSSNELIDDVATGDLRFVTANYGLATAILQEPSSGTNRIQAIADASAAFRRFLHLCDTLQAVPRGVIPDDDDDAAPSPEVLRTRKIDNFRRTRDIRQRLATLDQIKSRRGETDDLDEVEREIYQLQIQLAALDAVNQMSLSERELDLLRSRPADDVAGEREQQSTTPAPPPHVVRIDKDMSVHQVRLGGARVDLDRRARERAAVFADRNKPTMTLDQFADLEIAAAKQRQQAAQDREAQAAKVDVDSEQHIDAETLQARAWDDWKDEHEKGVGNKGYT